MSKVQRPKPNGNDPYDQVSRRSRVNIGRPLGQARGGRDHDLFAKTDDAKLEGIEVELCRVELVGDDDLLCGWSQATANAKTPPAIARSARQFRNQMHTRGS